MLQSIFKGRPSAELQYLNTRHWESADGLSRGCKSKAYPAHASAHVNAEIAQQILTSYKTQESGKHAQWLERLVDDSLRYIADKRRLQLASLKEEALYQQATAAIIDQIFDLLLSLSYDFNTSLGWSRLRITGTSPTLVTEVLRYNKFREPLQTITHYRARLSTSLSSLVIRGSKDKVDILILRSQDIMGLSRSESSYQPVVELTARLVNESIEWQVEGELLTAQKLDELCLASFSTLIDHSRDEGDAC